jgi:nitrite reductase/ring-hydroxylating ferredoxin subunit
MAEFQKVARAPDVPPGACRTVSVGDRALALCNVDGTFYALTNTCPHRGGPLGEGVLQAGELSCPWHGWTFDVKTGAMTRNPRLPAALTYPVRVEGDDVLVAI